MKRNGNGRGKCVYTTATLATLEDWQAQHPGFVLPAPYKPCKSYPLDAHGIDPRDKEATLASRRYFGIRED